MPRVEKRQETCATREGNGERLRGKACASTTALQRKAKKKLQREQVVLVEPYRPYDRCEYTALLQCCVLLGTALQGTTCLIIASACMPRTTWKRRIYT